MRTIWAVVWTTIVIVGCTFASSCQASGLRGGGNAPTPGLRSPGSGLLGLFDGVGSLRAQEVLAVVREGVPEARAQEAIEVQEKLGEARLVRKLSTAMGAAYAGAWFDPASARLHIGAVSAAGGDVAQRTAARAGLLDDVTITPVRSTWNQLIDTQKWWDRRLAGLFARSQVETSLTPQDNAVAIKIGSSVPSAQRARLEREAVNSAVAVHISTADVPRLSLDFDAETKCASFKPREAYCNKPITPGVTIASQDPVEKCTAGPLVLPSVDRSMTYLLTAGHCVRRVGAGKTWSAFNTSGTRLALGRGSFNIWSQTADVGLIRVLNKAAGGNWTEETGNAPVFAVTANWEIEEGKKSFPVLGERGPPVVGEDNCVEGQVTGSSCGPIEKLNVGYTTMSGVVIEGLVEDGPGAISQKGDSGGPVIVEAEGGGKYLVEGTDVAHIGDSPWAVYEPIETALKALNMLRPLGLELVTSSNEARPTETKAEEEAGVRIENLEKEEELALTPQMEQEEKTVKEHELEAKEEEAEALVLFLISSGKELLFSTSGELVVLRGLNAGVLGTITCEHNLLNGFALSKSPLARRILVEFRGKCKQVVGAGEGTCAEPIRVKELLGELGLIILTTKSSVVGLSLAPNSGTEFAKIECTNGNTTVEGAVVGAIPEVSKKAVGQYGKHLTEAELKLETENKNENQRPTTIDLLGTEMTKVELKFSGFFGGKMSEEVTDILKTPSNGWVEICIHPLA